MPFQSVAELGDVLGMTPDLLARLTPHLTVLTDGDPDMSTHDAVVARAVSDAAGVADLSGGVEQTADQVLRISATAVGNGPARYSMVIVASADFQNASPRVNILLRERDSPGDNRYDSLIKHQIEDHFEITRCYANYGYLVWPVSGYKSKTVTLNHFHSDPGRGVS